MIGHVWRAHGTEQYRVVLLELFKAIVGNVLPMRFVRGAAPIVVSELEREFAKGECESFEYLDSCANYFGPDAVSGDGGDFVGRMWCASGRCAIA